VRYRLAIACVGIAAGCGSPMKPPVTGVLVMSSVSPSTLSTTGGATVTIQGAGFGTDTTVTIGGVPVSGATVSESSITATAPIHAAGASTVVVTSGAKSGSLSVTFVAPSGINAPPVISGLRVNGLGNKPPSPFVDLASSVTLSATVTDVETSPASLVYAWTVAAGTVSGSGSSVTWNLPASLAVTPSAQTVTLTVTEQFTENGVQHRNAVSTSLLADVHDSQNEILDKGFRFLDLFSQSQYTTDQVLADFAPSCYGGNGRGHEADDVNGNRDTFLELPGYSVTRKPPVSFIFNGTCEFSVFNPTRRFRADACAVFDVRWNVRYLHDTTDNELGLVPAGSLETTIGQDYVSATLQNGAWQLCTSDFKGTRTTTFPSGLKKFGVVIR
jgi:hypothetical protein